MKATILRRRCAILVATLASVAILGALISITQFMPTRTPPQPTAETYRELMEHRRIRAESVPLAAPASVLKSY